MESEKGKVVATNNSVDNPSVMRSEEVNATTNDPVDEPWNRLIEKHLRALTRTLRKREIIGQLVKLGMTFPQAAEEIRDSVRLYHSYRKLLVYGLSEETTSESLCNAISVYGEIAQGEVMVDSATGKSRRFGYVTFKNIKSFQESMKHNRSFVDGNLAYHCFARDGLDGAIATADVELRRLYVSCISMDVTNEMFLDFFAKYGEIEEGSLIYHDESGKSKGSGFVSFKTLQAAMDVINDSNMTLGRSRIFVRHAHKYMC